MMAQVFAAPSAGYQPCRSLAAIHVDQDVLCGDAGSGRIRIERAAPPPAAGGVEVAGVDGLHLTQDCAVSGHIGNNPADPRVPFAAVEKEAIHTVNGRLRRGCQYDLHGVAITEDGQHFLVGNALPHRRDHPPGEIQPPVRKTPLQAGRPGPRRQWRPPQPTWHAATCGRPPAEDSPSTLECAWKVPWNHSYRRGRIGPIPLPVAAHSRAGGG